MTEENNIELFSNLQNIENIKPTSIVNGSDKFTSLKEIIVSPYNRLKILGEASHADDNIIKKAIEELISFSKEWKNTDLDGLQVIKPPHNDLANAVGAAIAQVL